MKNTESLTERDRTEKKLTFFMSDAHVGSWDEAAEKVKEEKLRLFFNYLTTISPPPALYILGDLFDFWFEYRHAIPLLYQKLVTRLVNLVEYGISIRYITGNHDFWIRDFFQKYLDIEVYHGEYETQIDGKSFYLFHGDGILSEDKGYRILKQIIQHPLVVKAYRWIHPDIGIPIARWSSAMSRNQYGKNPEIEKQDDEKYLSYAGQIFKDQYDFILMGHTHRPVIVTNSVKTYINLGDWIRNFTYAVFDGSEIKLYRWLAAEVNNPPHLLKKIEPEIRNF
ncbi:MAG TPA: UDP-2,3-diacylglucosamine diphosphatase [Bacteroidetes bacterium]|nr:UDP-2,3-diacylglucosamine diphosphatase [Bacteroidota bacterium]